MSMPPGAVQRAALPGFVEQPANASTAGILPHCHANLVISAIADVDSIPAENVNE
jgi:hypothetical protein